MECSLVPYKLYVCAENGMRKCTKVRFWRLHFLAYEPAVISEVQGRWDRETAIFPFPFHLDFLLQRIKA